MDAKNPVCASSEAAYRCFMIGQYSSMTFLALILVNFVFNSCVFSDMATVAGVLHGDTTYWIELVSLVFRALVSVALCFMWLQRGTSQVTTQVAQRSALAHGMLLIQNAFPVIMCTAFAYHVAQKLSNLGGSFVSVGLALDALKLYPLMTVLMMSDANQPAILLSWAISLTTLFGVSIWLQSWDQFNVTLGYVVGSLMLAYNNEKRNRAVFQLIERLQNTLAENERLEAASRAEELRAMIGNVAHDLKTPLTSFLCGIECMTSVVDSWEGLFTAGSQAAFLASAIDNFRSLRNCLQSMEGTNSFMAMAINRCIDYTKASKGLGLVPRYETIMLDAKIDAPVRLIRGINAGVAVVVRPRSPDICSHIITDQQWLIENILCLLSNAVKYSDRGAVELSVRLQDCADASTAQSMGTVQCLRFEVLDAGVGLSDEAMQTLFNPFKQAQRLAGGTGLGLFSLAKRVEALHGQYGVSRRPDGAQGSLFWFTIPYRPDETSARVFDRVVSESGYRGGEDSNAGSSASVPTKLASPKAKTSASAKAGQTVLIVDDAPLVVKLTTLLLSQRGQNVIGKAANGAEALDRILGGYDTVTGVPPFDVVLMDLQMPVLDGIEAIRRLRAHELRMETKANIQEIEDGARDATDEQKENTLIGEPVLASMDANPVQLRRPRYRAPFHQFVVALSANSDCETKQEALAAGADAFLPKPFTYEAYMDVASE